MVTYSLYQDNSHTTFWGSGISGGPVVNDVGNGSDQNHVVYGVLGPVNDNQYRIYSGQSDTINVSVNY